jgi:hypothetical protein
MKQYDSIWVPDDSDGMKECFDPQGDPIKDVSSVIVLSIEELRDFYVEGFEDGYDSAAYSNGNKNHEELFKAYLQSKGITLTPNT